MRLRLLFLFAVMGLLSCNSDQGPEYRTPAEFGEVSVSSKQAAFESDVCVKVSVSCPYGLRHVSILYMLDDDASDVRSVAKSELENFPETFDFKGVIPRQRPGRKVTFWIQAITKYNVSSYTEPKDYMVPRVDKE